MPNTILKLVPETEDFLPEGEYYVTPISSGRATSAGPVLGFECRSYADLENVIRRIKVDLDLILEDGKKKKWAGR